MNEPHDGIVNIPGSDLRLACHIIYPSNDPNNRLATKRCDEFALGHCALLPRAYPIT